MKFFYDQVLKDSLGSYNVKYFTLNFRIYVNLALCLLKVYFTMIPEVIYVATIASK